MSPKTLQMLLIAAAIGYLILPYDLVPDFFGLPGRIDDLLMMVWLAWLYQTRGAEWLGRGGGVRGGMGDTGGSTGRASTGNDHRARTKSNEALADPHQVLGVGTAATADEVRAAYRERMQEYHPDKVAHLGKDLQDLALVKSQQIQDAYQRIQRIQKVEQAKKPSR